MRNLIKHFPQFIDQEMTIYGWVHARRDHGKIIFLDIRDISGIMQVVISPESTQAYEEAKN